MKNKTVLKDPIFYLLLIISIFALVMLINGLVNGRYLQEDRYSTFIPIIIVLMFDFCYWIGRRRVKKIGIIEKERKLLDEERKK